MKNIISILFILLAANLLLGQKGRLVQEVNVKNTKAVYLGTKKPHFKGTDPASLRSRSKEGKKKYLPPNFFGRGKNKVVRPELEHQGPDPIRQPMMKTLGNSVEPVLNFEGISSSWGSPNDPSGAAGISHYVMAVNATTIGIYDKTLKSLFMPNL